MGPGTMALAAVQINILVNTMLATSQGEGAASCLNFAFRVMYLPIGIFRSDGARHDGARRRADQHPRQHDAGDEPGRGGCLVPELRVPGDVPADRDLPIGWGPARWRSPPCRSTSSSTRCWRRARARGLPRA